ncbi:MAG TPA: ParB/RepB/Spo0J family partition protein [Candidatus Evtepia excrementipullorum]|uniref:ParB/RepB/Spo0J family partition protein n=1 Tax=Evtepia sp. TaxID=2773933 RepID=UPI001FA40B73|nr:ParB/RepB/Spo0J family partition protein [Candidatus Evtepia excrementipullorum]
MPVLYRRGLLESTRVTMLSPDVISPNPDQPRRYFDPDGLYELAESIRVHGILQPLSVRRKGGGRYELIAGERRLRAAMICGLEQVPCLVLEVSRESSCLLSLIENLQRRDLDFWEEAKALERLTTVYGLSQEEAAAKVGKSQSAVANKLRLLRLPQEVLALLRKHGFTERHARALLRLPTPEAQAAGADLLVKEGWTVARTEKYVEEVLCNQTKGKKTRPPLLIRDVRFFLNSLDHSLAVMRSAGVAAQCQRKEEGEDLLLTIRIPKAKGQSPSGSGPA